jgi:uncharacterized membrane protein (UPF0127 family)
MVRPVRSAACFGLISLAALACEGSMGCEKHVDEPTRTVPAAVETTPEKRCIHETPSVPNRIVEGPSPDPDCPDDPGDAPHLPLGTVAFPDAAADGGSPELAVEIAEKYEDRMRGLMYRKGMRPNSGMLFVFDEEEVRTFWMKNTCIPLDMVFIGADGVIVGIEENTPTLHPKGDEKAGPGDTFSPGCPAMYVLETNAGWTRKHGVKAGQHATWAKLGRR